MNSVLRLTVLVGGGEEDMIFLEFLRETLPEVFEEEVAGPSFLRRF